MKRLVFISDDRCAAARSAATELINEGYDVVINRLGGPEVSGTRPVTLNLSDFTALDTFFASCGEAFHAVIHPAPPPIRVSIADATDAQWQEAFDQGAQASMQITRAAGKYLKELGRGAIIYLGSIHSEKPMGYGFLHSMSLAATSMLCREAALDFGRYNVNCIHVQRGVYEEDMVNKSDLSNVYSSPATRYPRQRMPEPRSLSGLLTFLLTEAASPLNGADLRADEGMTMFYGHMKDEEAPE
ncbi:MAG: SDR family NAD(P)-dependent oxidoreductase [Eubacteriales bacterium]|nr:SDR family NAD(P)-dependent oxidoreductase [Eubacteriales bacterium]MDD3866704.1 SDR family NAD(P)-dependent oxidoreductase [Eubacteriales bacterium]MDD4461144.1 SDR family NAD(P)-dependent oxidoreductase [Eubacteriales bacterium]